MKSLFVSVTGLVTIFFGCLPAAAESSFSSIVTSTAPGSENYSVSCDPEGRGTAYDGAKLDSYDNAVTNLDCEGVREGNAIYVYQDNNSDTSTTTDKGDEPRVIIVQRIGARVNLVNRRDSVTIDVITPSNMKFSIFSTKTHNVYRAHSINGIRLDLERNGMELPSSAQNDSYLLLESGYVTQSLGNLLAQLRTRDAAKVYEICSFLADEETIEQIIDAGLSSVAESDDFEDQYFYWKSKPLIPVRDIFNIARGCAAVAKEYR